MNICVINDEKIIADVREGAKWFPVDKYDDLNTIVVVNDSTPVFFECEFSSRNLKGTFARRAVDLSGVTMCEVDIFSYMMDWYREINDVQKTIGKYKDLTEEKFNKTMTEAIDTAARHNRLLANKTDLLKDVYIRGKSKKQILAEDVEQFYMLKFANHLLFDELRWCFGIYNDWVLDRLVSFDSGTFEFMRTVDEFAKEHNVAPSLLYHITDRVLQCQKVLTEDEKQFAADAIKNNRYKHDITADEREKLRESVRIIWTHFKAEEDELYKKEAQKFIDNNIIRISDIEKHCMKEGLDSQRIEREMIKLGTHPVIR